MTNKIALLISTVMMCVTFWIVYALLFETSPIVYNNIPFPVVNNKLYSGEVIPFRVNRCNKLDHTIFVAITRTLENLEQREFIILPEAFITIPPGCTESISYANKLPDTIKPGVWKLIGIVKVSGTLKVHNIFYYTEPFVVLPEWRKQ